MKSLIALAFGVGLCLASNKPELQWDPDTIDGCATWYNNVDDETCEDIRDLAGLSPEEFHRYNPSVGLDCKPWRWQSYCVFTEAQQSSLIAKMSHITTTTTTTSTTTTSNSSHVPSPTAWKALDCFIDDDPDLTLLSIKLTGKDGDKSLTIADCEHDCWKASVNDTVLVAGVKEGDECWCGSSVPGPSARNVKECNKPCSGDSKEMCGGKDRMNVFLPVTPLWGELDGTMTASTGMSTVESSTSETTAATTGTVNEETKDSGAMRYRALFGGQFRWI